MLLSFALSVALVALPSEWTGVADVSPVGLAKSAAAKCPAVIRDCSDHFQRQVDTLAAAWSSEFTTDADRATMLKAIEDNTDAAGTDWYGAQLNYFARRELAMRIDGRRMREWAPTPAQRRARGWSFRTRCYSYFSRFGNSVYSWCDSYER